MQNANVLELISNLGQIVSANDDSIRIARFSFKLYFTMEYQVKLIWKQGCDSTIGKKTKDLISLPADSLSCNVAIC